MDKQSPTSVLSTRVIPIEEFLMLRASQSSSQAMMFERFNKLADWHGGNYTQKQIDDAKLDAEKCREALKFLKEKYKKKVRR